MSRLFRRLRYVWRNFDHPLAEHCIAVEDKLAIIQREREYAWGEKNRLLGEVLAQRDIIADLGRRLHAAQCGPLGDNPLTTTAPMPRVRSQAVPTGLLLTDYSIGPHPRPHAGQ